MSVIILEDYWGEFCDYDYKSIHAFWLQIIELYFF